MSHLPTWFLFKKNKKIKIDVIIQQFLESSVESLPIKGNPVRDFSSHSLQLSLSLNICFSLSLYLLLAAIRDATLEAPMRAAIVSITCAVDCFFCSNHTLHLPFATIARCIFHCSQAYYNIHLCNTYTTATIHSRLHPQVLHSIILHPSHYC